jgi:tetratricopeptide (TPR) repeat protein
MGTAPSVVHVSDSVIAVRKFDSKTVPKCGVKLAFFEEFVESCGGREALKDKTTTDVCNEFVKPKTQQYRCSYCNYLEASKHAGYGASADVFISHAWKYKFLDVVDILSDHFKDREDITIWFDLFTNNQHQAVDLEYNWWATTFLNSIKDFQYTVMILIPWNDPIPLKRAWCLFELYCTHQTGCRFEVAMGDKGRNEFTKVLDTGDAEEVLNNMLGSIDVSRSEAYFAADREKIIATVREKVGLSHLNGIVLSLMRDWVLSMSLNEFDVRKKDFGELDPRTLMAMHNLGVIYEHVGKYEEAEMLIMQCHQKRQAILGDNHAHTLDSLNALANLYLTQRKYEAAEPLLISCLELRRQSLGESNRQTLQSINNLAVLYNYLFQWEKAEPLYIDCFEKSKAVFGEVHTDTLLYENNLGYLYSDRGDYEKAEPYLLGCYAKHKAEMGETHPRTVIAMNILAYLYCEQGKFDAAKPLLIDCLEKRKTLYGDAHPDTLAAIDNLAGCFYKQGKYDEAESLFVDCLSRRKAVLGENHPDTLYSMSSLAYNYEKQHKFKKAERLHKSCYEKSKAAFGDAHEDTEAYMKSLVEFYENKKTYESEHITLGCLVLGRKSSKKNLIIYD